MPRYLATLQAPDGRHYQIMFNPSEPIELEEARSLIAAAIADVPALAGWPLLSVETSNRDKAREMGNRQRTWTEILAGDL